MVTIVQTSDSHGTYSEQQTRYHTVAYLILEVMHNIEIVKYEKLKENLIISKSQLVLNKHLISQNLIDIAKFYAQWGILYIATENRDMHIASHFPHIVHPYILAPFS